MDMKVNSQLIIKERKIRAWSQQHLAEVAELSLRTVQRIEKTGNSSPESTKAIAASLDFEPHDLILTVQNEPSFSVFKRKYIFAPALAILFSFFYMTFVTAEPVMLNVIVKSDGNELANASLLSNEGKESEIRIDKLLKILMLSEITSEKQIRINIQIFEFGKDENYKLIAKPTLLTRNNKVASITITDDKGFEYFIDITPRI